MSHPSTSIGHDALVSTLEETIRSKKSTTNESYLAEVFLAVYEVVKEHPGVVNVINNYALRAIERNEADGTE